MVPRYWNIDRLQIFDRNIMCVFDSNVGRWTSALVKCIIVSNKCLIHIETRVILIAILLRKMNGYKWFWSVHQHNRYGIDIEVRLKQQKKLSINNKRRLAEAQPLRACLKNKCMRCGISHCWLEFWFEVFFNCILIRSTDNAMFCNLFGCCGTRYYIFYRNNMEFKI